MSENMPLTGLEPVLLPPEGNALSTELQGLLHKMIADSSHAYKRPTSIPVPLVVQQVERQRVN